MDYKHLTVQTPGRICLFGEHQDYLGLPVIPMAISLNSQIKGKRIKGKGDQIVIHKPDLNEKEIICLKDLSYTKKRDYFKSAIKVCMEEGLTFSDGLEIEISSNIPIQAGCSSSTSIMVGWIHFLSQIADYPINWSSKKIAELAYTAEVLEFSEPGGMMDQYSTAIGGLMYLESKPDISITNLKPLAGTFVLGDSQEKKNTLDILERCNQKRKLLLHRIKQNDPFFNLHTIDLNDVSMYVSFLNESEMKLLKGTLKNRDILISALAELESENPDFALFGNLLNDHHTILRDVLNVSTPKIEQMLTAALNAGALGGKINGSGGGGCMFAFAPDDPQKVADAIEQTGGKAYILSLSGGTKLNHKN